MNLLDVGMPGEALLAVRTVDGQEGRKFLSIDILLHNSLAMGSLARPLILTKKVDKFCACNY